METDSTGKVVWSADYSAFGASGAEAGSFVEQGRYTGKDFDEEVGLYYSNARRNRTRVMSTGVPLSMISPRTPTPT